MIRHRTLTAGLALSTLLGACAVTSDDTRPTSEFADDGLPAEPSCASSQAHLDAALTPVIYPRAGVAGTVVTICGSGFGATQGASVVAIRGNKMSVVRWSDTALQVTVPAWVSAGVQPLTITTAGGTAAARFTVRPTISGSTLTADEPRVLTVTGANLGTTQGMSKLRVGGVVLSARSWSMNTIVAEVPAGDASTVSVIVGSQEASGSVHRNGLELAYDNLNQGDVASADLILSDMWPVDRYAPVALPKDLSWREDPYKAAYWLYIFYGLQPTRHLLFAYQTTGLPKYRAKLIEVLRSFRDRGLESPLAADRHGTAWRAMILTNTYWKLKEIGGLSAAEEALFIDLVRASGRFLTNPKNFESDYNHGIAESMGLLMLATNFPDLPESAEWLETSGGRLEAILGKSVAPDGVVYEQAFYYHFYELVQFWAIAAWAKKFDIHAAPSIATTIEGMIRFATYIPMPDGMVPMLGASLVRSARTSEPVTMAQIAEHDPSFKYVFTSGAAGTVPPKRCVLFPVSGPSIMRSGWGPTGFASETHVVMDVGPYRTSHSDLDALSVHLYANGKTLLSDAGLFTYDRGVEYTYFKSTAAHNTVTVDESDQSAGAPVMGLEDSGPTHCYQSGYHDLYAGVRHRRGTVLVDKDLVVVLDHLTSSAAHTFDQNWRTPPALRFVPEAAGARVVDANGKRLLTIAQAYPGFVSSVRRGSTAPFDGWYSEAYEVKTPADVLRFRTSGPATRYATLLASGAYATQAVALQATGDDARWEISVTTASKNYTVIVRDFAAPTESIDVQARSL